MRQPRTLYFLRAPLAQMKNRYLLSEINRLKVSHRRKALDELSETKELER